MKAPQKDSLLRPYRISKENTLGSFVNDGRPDLSIMAFLSNFHFCHSEHLFQEVLSPTLAVLCITGVWSGTMVYIIENAANVVT